MGLHQILHHLTATRLLEGTDDLTIQIHRPWQAVDFLVPLNGGNREPGLSKQQSRRAAYRPHSYYCHVVVRHTLLDLRSPRVSPGY